MKNGIDTSTRWVARIVSFALLAVTMGAACGDREPAGSVTRLTADGAVIIDSTREYQGLNYSLDGEKYGKWVIAQRSLDAIPDLTVPTQVSLRNFTEDDVDRAADWLEKDERARIAIRSADLSAKDYVRTSVALEQLMATMSETRPLRFRDLPPQNVDFIARDTGIRRTFDARRVRVVGDDSDDRDSDARDSDSDSEGNRAINPRDGVDSDKDSERKGNGKGKAKGKGKGGDSDSR